MLKKISEIAIAWITAANPTPRQKELAEKRYEKCKGCEYFNKRRPVTGDEYCTVCSCPISKKIFSKNFDACPKHYWLEVEEPYFKTEKSIL
jgi:hypothetical protein